MQVVHCTDTIRPPHYRPLRIDIAALAWFVLRRLGYEVGRGLNRLLLWTERSRQRCQLARLNEHMLRDLGLSRADVLAETTKPFWRP